MKKRALKYLLPLGVVAAFAIPSTAQAWNIPYNVAYTPDTQNALFGIAFRLDAARLTCGQNYWCFAGRR